MVYGGVGTNVYNALSPNQGSNLNGRATKRFRRFESRNLERGFAELSIHPTPVSSLPHIQQQQQQPDTRVGGDGVWSDVVGNVGESSCVVCPDGSTLPLLRSSSVDEPPSPDVYDIQMSTPTWYEPEKDSESPTALSPTLGASNPEVRNSITGIIITSLDDDEYDGDDELGQQQQRAGTNSIAQGSEFTISPAFLNAINKKLTQAASPTDASASQALVLFRPLPTIALPPAEDDLEDPSGHADFEGGALYHSPPKPPPPSPSLSSPFYVQDSGRPSFVCNDDDMEIEML